MIADLDIWRATNLLMRHTDAEIEAARKADLMLERADPEGQIVWMRIKLAVLRLQDRWQARRTNAGPLCRTPSSPR